MNPAQFAGKEQVAGAALSHVSADTIAGAPRFHNITVDLVI
jgi:hypothetical protein